MRSEATARQRKPSKPRTTKRAEAKATEWRTKQKDLFDSLVQGVSNVDLDGWKSMLVRQTDFLDYSFQNTCMILVEWESLKRRGIVEGEITTVAPRTRWARRNRTIREDMRRNGLPIFVPMVKKVDENEEEKRSKTIRFFRIRWVYDVTQTEGAEWERPHPMVIGGDVEKVRAYTDKLVDFLSTKKGIRVEFRPISIADPVDMTVQGYWSAQERLIVVGTRTREGVTLDAPMGLRILLHEAAHALHGHDGQDDGLQARGLREVEAESTAFIVGTTIGLGIGDYSFGYVASWLQALPADRRGVELLGVGGKVTKVARELVSGLGVYGTEEARCATD